jgi:hypothetical protein
MSRTYSIHTRTYGTILKTDDTIAAARAWAKTALGDDVISVTPPAAKPCSWCGGTPSLCGCRGFKNRHED